TDIVVVGIVLGPEAAALYAIPAKLFTLAFGLGSVGTNLLYPALAEHEGAGEDERQRRLLLAGLRGGTAAAVLLALPLLLIPDQLIKGWVGDGYGESSPVLVLLALVLLVHQPIYLVTQFLIARARQRAIARALVLAGVANVILSVILATTVGLWGVALSTLLSDVAVLLYVVPALVAPAASLPVGAFVRSALRPVVPAAVAALLVLVAVARLTEPDTLLELLPLGLGWLVACGVALWRFGFDASERATIGRQLRPPAAPVPEGL
ncbi:MAG: polysaccharide biosynthesis C-terminal domain-containing protein, partial [Actinobacteria bacterium]|nr:polysaccharide biosynthesis C-terminal domain-containing protein [Actinomycetota bacterium]